MNNIATVIKEIEGFDKLTMPMLERWADIPVFSENDPENPEWKSTPIVKLDLTSKGYALVYVKDESDRKSNPTGTIKDRMSWELVCLYRDFARTLLMKNPQVKREINKIKVPRLSYITSGNVGNSTNHFFTKYILPPMKIVVGEQIDPRILEELKKLHADIYQVDLREKALTPRDIMRISKNENGIDITSIMAIEPQAIFYDWHVHEAFNENPDMIMLPYGSGRLMENYLTWQQRNTKTPRITDPRLKITQQELSEISIMGAKPESEYSIADKLSTHFNPFEILNQQDTEAMRALRMTGTKTGFYQVVEEKIKEAHAYLKEAGINAEPSAAAGLALYLTMFEQRTIQKGQKVLVINTGKGISFH